MAPISIVHMANPWNPCRDAAHTVHPLAGQGLNIGLQDSEVLGSLLVDAYERGGEWSSPHRLSRYEEARELPNATMITLIDAIKHLFVDDLAMTQSNNPLVAASAYAIRGIRGLGMSAVNLIPPVKNAITRFAGEKR
eukprot:gb/GECG01007082.1/.p1 GENE.gb/GECG01007082.1/~~gb/GECG01007082.1/.p1  ORF type:complete len:137 (+),score=5.75 gb/GECG01007082.1/:1-411(+)